MRLVFRREARDELRNARRWYEARRVGLGDAFLDDVGVAIEAIAEDPLRWAIAHRDLRRSLVHRFPYQIIYKVEHTRVVIIAVLHGRRDPADWQHRG